MRRSVFTVAHGWWPFFCLCFLLGGCWGRDRGKDAALAFASATFSADESASSATITVRRLGRKSGAVSVDYATSDGTAAAPADYSDTSGTLSWADGETADKSFAVPLTDDPVPEGDETVDLALSNPTGDAAIVSPSEAVLIIVNDDCLSSGALDLSFGAAGVAAINQSPNTDSAYDIVIDQSFMYVTGQESSSCDMWRIEKRSLANGSPDPGFGTGGVVRSDPSPRLDLATGMAVDSSFLYVVGSDMTPGYFVDQWRIEKRNLADGSLVPGFGTAGVVTNDPSIGPDSPTQIAIDSTFMYVIGFDSDPRQLQWRIEKRRLTDGALDPAFGLGGVIRSDPSTGPDRPEDLAIDTTFMYVVGNDDTGPSAWRIEKRRLADGSLDPGFGITGVVWSYPSIFGSGANGIAIDASFLYVIGSEWRIEKRSLANGSLDPGFGTAGVVTGPGGVQPADIAVDAPFLYVFGGDWRIEKRSLVDGSLDPGFGTGGVVRSDPSPEVDRGWGLGADSSFLYLVGWDQTPGRGDPQWRIEKRCK